MRRNPNAIDAKLVPESERYTDWNYILDGDDVPLKSGHPQMSGSIETYDLDFDRMRPIQFERLVQTVIKRLDLSHSEAYKQVRTNGFRIRCEDVRIVKATRNFL